MLKTLTSKTIEDEREPNGTYKWDCYNTDYCKVKRKSEFDYLCLAGAHSPRCSYELKVKIKDEAIEKGFRSVD